MIEFVDNGKGFECSGIMILGDRWENLKGTITFQDKSKKTIQLEAEQTIAPFEWNETHFMGQEPEVTLSFINRSYDNISISGKANDQFLDLRGKITGDILSFWSTDQKGKPVLPGRIAIREGGTLLTGTMRFSNGTGIRGELGRKVK